MQKCDRNASEKKNEMTTRKKNLLIKEQSN